LQFEDVLLGPFDFKPHQLGSWIHASDDSSPLTRDLRAVKDWNNYDDRPMRIREAYWREALFIASDILCEIPCARKGW
jgi:hypothetical protein